MLNSEWYYCSNKEPVTNARKYIKVKITDIKPCNNDLPLKVFFCDENSSDTFYIYTVLSGTLNSTRRNQFQKIFSNDNPRDKYKNINASNWNAITISDVLLGMTQEEVKLSLGNPSEIKRIPTYNGLRLIWYYNSGKMIYFEDGLVKEIRK